MLALQPLSFVLRSFLNCFVEVDEEIASSIVRQPSFIVEEVPCGASSVDARSNFRYPDRPKSYPGTREGRLRFRLCENNR